MYDLYTKVIHARRKARHTFKDIETIRKELRVSDLEIDVLDLGAGSRVNKSNRRKVSQIARNAEKSARFGRFFYALSTYLSAESILELGTSLGLTTAYFAKADSAERVITLEGCPETVAIARANFQRLGLGSVTTIVGNIDETFPKVLAEEEKGFDLIFFDANHRFEPTVRYFETAKKYARPKSVFIFDDIYWSDEMKRAWEVIKADPDVTVTIDLFWIGLVFFRKEQPKENFTLRF